MRIAIISDIHGNYEALNAVMRDIELQNIDEIVCLGDVVGYGASPNECTDLVREKCKHIVAGNHDFAVVGKTDISFFNPYAKQAMFWTRQALTTQNFSYLSNLPLSKYEKKWIYVHATPLKPEAWGYIFSNYEAVNEFSFFTHKICFIGHSHYPVIIEYKDTKSTFLKAEILQLEDDKRYIVNVGSVGQPRDGNPKSCYLVFDADNQQVTFQRIDYDIEAAQNRIILAGLPKILSDRLAIGK